MTADPTMDATPVRPTARSLPGGTGPADLSDLSDLGLSGRAVVMHDVQSVVINIFLPCDASSPPSEA